MAVFRKDALAKILGDPRINSRRDIFLGLYLVDKNTAFRPEVVGGPGMRDRIAEFLHVNPERVPTLRSALSLMMPHDKHFTWITDDERQHQWLIPHFQQTVKFSLQHPCPNLLGRALVIGMIDVWDADLNTKVATLKHSEHLWKQQQQQDRVFRWFKEEDEAQRCALAWDWLSKYKQVVIPGNLPISSYNELLILSDRIQWSEAEKAHCVDTCSKRWSQQKYRKNLKGKKQCNFVLSEKVIQQLDQWAEAYDLTRPQILETLIKMEAEMNNYLPEKMKRLTI